MTPSLQAAAKILALLPVVPHGSIAWEDIPFPFLGVVLESAFFQKQMARIKEKDAAGECPWVVVDGVDGLFGGGVVESAVVLRDPDGFPCVFFVSQLLGADYRERFPSTPFVYGAAIMAPYPDDPADEGTIATLEARLKSCKVLGENGTDTAPRSTPNTFTNSTQRRIRRKPRRKPSPALKRTNSTTRR